MPELILPGNSVRSVKTKKQLRDRVRSELAQISSNWIRDQDVDDWLLEFQQVFARDEEWLAVSDTFLTSGGTRYYDLPADCISLRVVQYGLWRLPHLSLEELLLDFPLALTDTYQGPLPWAYSVDGANRLMLFPTPTGASGVLVIYASLPPEPVADDDLYFWPPFSDGVAVLYACVRGAMKDLSREGARRIATFEAAYEREYAKAAARVRGRVNEDPIIVGKLRLPFPGRGGLRGNIWPGKVPVT